MRIGIIINPFEKLSNWELRIIQGIIENPAWDLSLIIRYAGCGNRKKESFRKKPDHLISSIFDLPGLLIKLQMLVEKVMFPIKTTVDKKFIFKYLETIDLLIVYTTKGVIHETIENDDVAKIRGYNLDLLINLEHSINGNNISVTARFGIWALSHSGYSGNKPGLAGFREITLKEPQVIATLYQLNGDYDEALIVDQAAFNLMPLSAFRTNSLVSEASVSLLFKNLRKLEDGGFGNFKAKGSFVQIPEKPCLSFTLKYILNFYALLFKKAIERIDYKLFGTRHYCWSIFTGEGNFMDSGLNDLKPLKMPDDQCWADPFLFRHNQETYIFYENYFYKTRKGIISCGRLFNGDLVEVIDVLEKDYHLSYPFIFEENGEIYLMPESRENKRLEVYRCVNFPDLWELYSTAFEGELVLDPFFFNDENDQKWLFVNKQTSLNAPVDCELHLYKVDSVKMNKLIPHKKNPVILNSKNARNGGPILKYNSEYYRPSQNSTNGFYGKSLNISKILKLTIDEYEEELVKTIEPDFTGGLTATHHLSQVNGRFVMDAVYRKISGSALIKL